MSVNNLCTECETRDAWGWRKAKWERKVEKLKIENCNEINVFEDDCEMILAKLCVQCLRVYKNWDKEPGLDDMNGGSDLLKSVQEAIALSIPNDNLQAAGLSFEEMEECKQNIIG